MVLISSQTKTDVQKIAKANRKAQPLVGHEKLLDIVITDENGIWLISQKGIIEVIQKVRTKIRTT